MTHDIDRLVDAPLERLVAGCLIFRPDLIERADARFGLDVVGDFQAQAVIIAVANLRERGATVTADAVASEMTSRGMQGLEAWFPKLVNAVPDVIDPMTFANQTASIVRLASLRSDAIDEADRGLAQDSTLTPGVEVRIEASPPEPEPLRRRVKAPSPYPADALGPLLGAAAKAMHSTVQAPLALCGQSVLAAASLAVQPHADVVIDGRQHPLSLFALTIAESGERKSAADRIALSAHAKYEREQIAASEAAVLEHGVQLAAYEVAMAQARKTKGGLVEIANAIKSCGKPPVPPPRGILTCREPTTEALQKLFLAGAPSIGMFADEGGSFIGGYSMNADNKLRTIATLCKLWDDGSSDRIRAGDGSSKIFGRRLALHILVQPVVAEKVLSDEMLVGQGFLARCLLVWPDTTAGTRLYSDSDPWQTPGIRGYAVRMRELLETVPRTSSDSPGELDPRKLGLSKRAKEVWTNAYNEIEKRMAPAGPFSGIRPWASKGAEQILRIAGVLTMTTSLSATEIDFPAMERATELVAWHLGEALRLVDVASVPAKVKHAESILRWCSERGLSLVGSSMLLNKGPNAIRDSETLAIAMDLLVSRGWATVVTDAVIDGTKARKAWRLRDSRDSRDSQRLTTD